MIKAIEPEEKSHFLKHYQRINACDEQQRMKDKENLVFSHNRPGPHGNELQ